MDHDMDEYGVSPDTLQKQGSQENWLIWLLANGCKQPAEFAGDVPPSGIQCRFLPW